MNPSLPAHPRALPAGLRPQFSSKPLSARAKRRIRQAAGPGCTLPPRLLAAHHPYRPALMSREQRRVLLLALLLAALASAQAQAPAPAPATSIADELEQWRTRTSVVAPVSSPRRLPLLLGSWATTLPAAYTMWGGGV